MYGKEDRKVRIVGQPRPLTPLMEDLLTKVQGEAGKMGAAAATFASDNCQGKGPHCCQPLLASYWLLGF